MLKKVFTNDVSGCAFLLISFFLAGCTSLVQKGGEVLEGNAFAAKRTALYSSGGNGERAKIELKEMRPRDGEGFIEITNSQWPGLALRGSPPGTDGSFHMTEARVLSSHVSGWNELRYELLGDGNFSPGQEAGGAAGGVTAGAAAGVLRIDEAPERVQISSGKIKLKGNRLTGNAALASLRNRRERILSLTEWMRERQEKTGNPVYFDSQKQFEEYWKSLLFPELLSAVKRKRLREYPALNTEWRRADGVKWNLSYTESLFPEGLWEFRNSGALLRDWEEALPWIFMEYSWDTIISTFNNETLKKTR
jgi:hypothetical protein